MKKPLVAKGLRIREKKEMKGAMGGVNKNDQCLMGNGVQTCNASDY